MRWLLHGNLTPAVGAALVRHGHSVRSPAEAEIEALDPGAVLERAHVLQLDIITADASLAEAPFVLGRPFSRSIVYLQLSGGDVEQDDAVDRLFARYKRLAPGRLYTVTGSRVKIRQLPTKIGPRAAVAADDDNFSEP
jgi:hypothetical protein